MISLEITPRTDRRLLARMRFHYSRPRGFVGRNICYAVFAEGEYFGHIVGGSSTKHLPGRHDFLGTNDRQLNNIVNNLFYNVRPNFEPYPLRNFTSAVVKEFCKTIQADWLSKYGDEVVGFETLVEKPRTGCLYKKAGWKVVGETKGYSCKRTAGKGTDSWSGKRKWNTSELKPKLVLCMKV